MPESSTIQDDPERLWTPRTFVFFSAIVLANLVVDFAAVAAYAIARVEATGGWSTRYVSGFCEGLLFGLFSAQIVGLAIWTALFPGKSTLRWLAGTLVILAGSVAVGVPVEGVSAFVLYRLGHEVDVSLWQFWAAALEDAVVTLLLYHLAQAPFWFERRALGMRFTRNPEWQFPRDRALRIVDLFGIVAFAAICMALARLAGARNDRFSFALMVATFFTAMLFFGNAFLWAIFRVRARALRILAYLALCQLFAWPFAAYVYFVEQTSRSGAPPWYYLLAICQGVGMGIVVVALANGEAARGYGYRLIGLPHWRWARPAETPTTISPAAVSPRP